SNGKHEGSLRYEYGNYDLKPETSGQFDFGFHYHSEHLSTEASVFSNTIQNYIYASKLSAQDGTDSIPDPSDPVPAYQYQQGKAQLQGGEISLDLHPHPLDWLHFENSFAWVNGVNKTSTTDSSKYLPFMPAPRYQSELRANFSKGLCKNAFLKIEFVHAWEQNKFLSENKTESRTPGYSLWNIGMGSDLTNRKGDKLLSIQFSVSNIFDEAYQNHLSRLKYASLNEATNRVGVFNMGRNFSVKIIVPVTLKENEK
ncbi:MAG: TonB-dependent receptor, partial [Flammeovirgaceae bacterium]|nr:TonB-dependent receptor [Flammeovirgaceae bacterium]